MTTTSPDPIHRRPGSRLLGSRLLGFGRPPAHRRRPRWQRSPLGPAPPPGRRPTDAGPPAPGRAGIKVVGRSCARDEARLWAAHSRAGRGAAVVGALALAVGLGQASIGASWFSSRYVVASGDTLSAIAQRFGVSVPALASANGISDPNFVEAGTSLAIPAGTGGGGSAAGRYVVASGDTLSAIAQRFGVSVSSLASANGISDPNFVEVGRVLALAGSGGGPQLDQVSGVGPSSSSSSSSSSAGWQGSSGLTTGLPAGLRDNPGRLALLPVFQAAASQAGIPASLLEAVSWQESGWQSGVLSSDGAIGVGQLLPDTVQFVTTQLEPAPLDPWVAADNITISARFLAYLLSQTGWDERMAVGAYYQGLASVRAEGLLPETTHYVADVLALQSEF